MAKPSDVDRWIVNGYNNAITFLCLWMVVWILIFPSSWLVGHWQAHDDLVMRLLGRPDGVVAVETVLKYAGHSVAQLTHTLPGALWAILAPFQLSKPFRKQYPRLHRWMGYVFLATSLLMTVGVSIIHARGLGYEDTFDDLPPLGYFNKLLVQLWSLWFASTALLSVYYARQRQYQPHKKFIYRHIAAGIWVALQRILLVAVYRPPMTREQQRATFGQSAQVSMAVAALTTEWALTRMQKVKQK